MSGAAWLSAMAAMMGAGLVKIFTVEENRCSSDVARRRSSLLTIRRRHRRPQCVQTLWRPSVNGQRHRSRPWDRPGAVCENLVERYWLMPMSPLILDADGLNTIIAAFRTDQLFYRKYRDTPPLARWRGLTGSPVEDIRRRLIPAARICGSLRNHLVLKDAVTVAAFKRSAYLHQYHSGNSSMAKAERETS